MVVGVREGTLYKLHGKPLQDLVHNNDNLCALWNRRFRHIHYRKFSIMREIVTRVLEFSIEKHGLCRGCALGKNDKDVFPRNKSSSKGFLDLIHSYVSG
jgi:hypothetical protein